MLNAKNNTLANLFAQRSSAYGRGLTPLAQEFTRAQARAIFTPRVAAPARPAYNLNLA